MRLFTLWLGVVTLGAVSACAQPLAPTPPTVVTPTAAPAVISLTVAGPTSAHESLLNITVTDASGKGVRDILVTLATTAGTLTDSSVRTSQTGTAQILLKATDDATVTASANGLTASVRAPAYRVPPVPPHSQPEPPPPPPVVVPPPPSCPTTPSLCPPPALVVVLTAPTSSVAVGAALTFTATVTAATLQPNEHAIAYQWDLDGSGTAEFTSTIPTHLSNIYTANGLVTAKVIVLTDLNRQATGTVQIIVTN